MERMVCPLEVKSLKERHFEGYGAVFRNVDYGGDVIEPKAFDKSLKAHGDGGTFPVMLWSHNPDIVIGKWHEVSEDSHGLKVRGEFANTRDGLDIYELVKMNAIGGMSIGYQTEKADFDRDGVRHLKQIAVHEVSLVAMPMNPRAKISNVKFRLSEKGEYVPTVREMEQQFRRMGCSKSVARMLVSRIFDDAGDGEMPGAPSGMLDDIDGNAISAAKAIADQILATTIRQAFTGR